MDFSQNAAKGIESRGMGNVGHDGQLNATSFVVIPRLDLDLSSDDVEFDNLNDFYSACGGKRLHSENDVKIGDKKDISQFKEVRRGKSARKEENCVIKADDVIDKLEKSLPRKKKKGKQKYVSGSNTDITLAKYSPDNSHGQMLLSHLKFLRTCCVNEVSKIGTEGPNRQRRGVKTASAYSESMKWWQRRPRISKKELLKISVHSLERYYDLFTAKLEEVSLVSESLFSEKKGNKILCKNIAKAEREKDELVRSLESISREKVESEQNLTKELECARKAYEEKEKARLQDVGMLTSAINNERQKWQEEADKLKRARDEIVKKIATKQNDLQKCQAEDKKKEEASKEKLESMQKKLELAINEKEQIEIEFKKLLQKQKDHNSGYEKMREKEIEKLKHELKLKEKENERLSAGLKQFDKDFKSMEGKNNIIVKNLREELVLKDQQLREIKDRFGNQFHIAKLLEETFCDKEAQSSDEKADKGDANANEWEKEQMNEKILACSSKSFSKHEHFTDAILPGKLETKNEENKDSGVKKFAVMKIEDIWQEQIACHESSVEKLKELQNLRRNLINSREELERSMKENLKLKESMIKENNLMENRVKGLLKKQVYEMQKKEEEIENLKLTLTKQNNEARKLTKELQKNKMIQGFKDEEIELLNATVKAENNNEYCVVTTESMMSFKEHMVKLRGENNSLLSYCDRVEEKVSDAKRELELTRKLANELSMREMNLQERCAELTSMVAGKDSSLKKLKESFRILQQRYEDTKEESKDQKSEKATLSAKFAKAQSKILETEEEKKVLEQEVSKLSKSLAETSRDLQKSVDMVCQLKIRYENVEERFKEEEGKIKQFSDEVIAKENEIKNLYDELQGMQKEKERMKRELEEVKREKEKEKMKNEFENEKSKEEVEDLKNKLEKALDDVENEKFRNEDQQKEIQRLKKELHKLTEKLENDEDVDKINSELVMLQKKLAILEEENDEIRRERLKMQSEMKGLEEEAEKSNSRNKMMDSENVKLFEELKTLEKDIGEKGKIINELENKLQKLTSENEEYKKEKQERGSGQFTGKRDQTGSAGSQTTRKIYSEGEKDDQSKGVTSFAEGKTEKVSGNDTTSLNVKGKQRSTDVFSDDDVFDFETSYTPCFGQKENESKGQKGQKSKKPSWLFDEVADTKAKKNPSLDRNKKDDSIFDDSFDDFLNDKKRQNSRNQPRGRRSAGNDELLFMSEQTTDKNNDKGKEDSPVKIPVQRQRRRGQSCEDASDELKRLVGF